MPRDPQSQERDMHDSGLRRLPRHQIPAINKLNVGLIEEWDGLEFLSISLSFHS